MSEGHRTSQILRRMRVVLSAASLVMVSLSYCWPRARVSSTGCSVVAVCPAARLISTARSADFFPLGIFYLLLLFKKGGQKRRWFSSPCFFFSSFLFNYFFWDLCAALNGQLKASRLRHLDADEEC